MIHILILITSIIIDLVFGDPPNKYHPTAWLGRFIGYIKPRLKDKDKKKELVKGSLAAIITISIVVTLLLPFSLLTSYIPYILTLLVTSTILKLSIAIRSMEEHANRVIEALLLNDLVEARRRVSMIVGRDTSNLDREHILSAIIESVSENTTDGIISPLFYYSLFGIVGSWVFRAINTLDSMLGYRDEYHKNIGYTSAKLDTIFNYLPARLVAILTIFAAILLRMDWKNAIKIIKRDSKNTPSLNSGWSMAGTAGALRIRLEKIGYYTIGDMYEPINVEHCYKSIKIMKVIVILFVLLVGSPLLLLRIHLGISMI